MTFYMECVFVKQLVLLKISRVHMIDHGNKRLTKNYAYLSNLEFLQKLQHL